VVAAGGTVNLSVEATGTAPLGFQWFKNGGMISGATASTLTAGNASPANSGVYYVAVSNATGLDVKIADDPLTCVARGTAVYLENIEHWKGTMESDEDEF